MLEVAEIFSSIQGEGPAVGRPAKFLRLSGCLEPLCSWCDTPEGLRAGKKMTEDEVVEALQIHTGELLVITGGEPFLQWNSGLCELDRRLHAAGIEVHYETSGKIPLPSTDGFIVCSPKYIDERWHVSDNIFTRADAFKFVVRDTFTHIEQFIDDHHIATSRIWIMPRGACRDEQLQRAEKIWQFCTSNRYNFSPRLHILIHDRKRGV